MNYLVFTLISIAFSTWQVEENNPSQPPVESATMQCQDATAMLRSVDGGQSWQDVGRGLPQNVQFNAIMAFDGELFLGATNGTILRSISPEMGYWQQEEVYQAFPDAGMSSNNHFITGIFPGAKGLYVCILHEGFYRKIEGTEFWNPMNGPAGTPMIQAVVERPDGKLILGTDTGIFNSTDGGKTWKHAYNKWWVNDIVDLGDVLLACSYPGLLRSTDGGETWEVAVADEGAIYQLSVIDGALAALRQISPSSSQDVVAPLRTTADGGKTWKFFDGGLSALRVFDLQQVGSYLFCSSSDGISRSADGGATWELVQPLIDPDPNTFFKLTVTGKTVYAVKMRGGC